MQPDPDPLSGRMPSLNLSPPQETEISPPGTPVDFSVSSGVAAVEAGPEGAAATLPFIPASRRPTLGDRDLPQHVGKYEIIEALGAGGMGVVFRAWDPDLKRDVALKMMRGGFFSNPPDISRFLLEREALARVKHPHIIPIHDGGHYDDQPYFVLAYMPGGSLDKRLAQFQGDVPAAVALVEKVARAVQELHRHDMLHRDLKPSNILFDELGQPFLSDFGLIKLLGEGGAELTKGNQGVGTPAYMAPEQTGLTRHPLGPATDVWALGVILFELLTGQRPFQAPENSALVQKILDDRPPRLQSLRGDLDPSLEAIVLKCLEKDPRDRYATADELADELARWLRGEPVQTSPDTLSRRLRRSMRRHPYRVVLGTVLFGALFLVPVIVYLRHPDRTLARIERNLAEGRPTTLIGTTGGPVWSERLSGPTGTARVGPDGFFTLSSWDLSLWRLCKDPQMTSYRFRAWVRHDQTHSGSSVGLFVAHERADIQGCPVHFFFLFGHNDLDDVKALYEKAAPPGFKIGPTGNTADLKPGILREGKASVINTFGGQHSAFFHPSGRKSGVWRELTIDVTPEALRASFDHLRLPPLVAKKVMADVNSSWSELWTKDPRLAPLAGFVPTYHPRGSLGLFVSYGTAAFRDVTVEPLPAPAKENP